MTLNDSKKVQNLINKIINDPLVKILAINSQLTQIQLETLLIDTFAEQIIEKRIGYFKKASMRMDKKISQGAFNRTLHQAKKNMIKSILTVFLLGYLGILETPSLSPFLETANKLEDYVNEYSIFKNKINNGLNKENNDKMRVFLIKELEKMIYNLISLK